MTTQVRHPIWFFAVGPAGARSRLGRHRRLEVVPLVRHQITPSPELVQETPSYASLMIISLEIPQFEPDSPFAFSWDRPPLVSVDVHDHYVFPGADKHGLAALAQTLLALAADEVPAGTELFVESRIGMTGSVAHLLVQRVE